MTCVVHIRAVAGICAAAIAIRSFICRPKPTPNNFLTISRSLSDNRAMYFVWWSTTVAISGVKLIARCLRMYGVDIEAAIARPISPPKTRNWVMAAVPTAV